MNERTLGINERLAVWALKRRFLRELHREDGSPRYGDLAADAVAGLSIGAVHRLREMLHAERDTLRDLGDHRAADSLTSALRELDSRIQILNDLLH